jgi:hypothetical protein
MRTTFYIDGFNLYYGGLQGKGRKWLDIPALCQRLMPSATSIKVKYFTARIRADSGDKAAPSRQDVYLRAIANLPNLEVFYGKFYRHKKHVKLVSPQPGGPKRVEAWATEEKGSDVNLAVQAVHDGHQKLYDACCIVSADSDLVPAIQIIQNDLALPVHVFVPQRHRSTELLNTATTYRKVFDSAVKSCQLPDPFYGLTKPSSW